MKLFVLALALSFSLTGLASTSIDKCVDAALEGARASLVANEGLDSRLLFIEEGGMLINDDAQYLQTRKELETFCRKLYIATVDIGE